MKVSELYDLFHCIHLKLSKIKYRGLNGELHEIHTVYKIYNPNQQVEGLRFKVLMSGGLVIQTVYFLDMERETEFVTVREERIRKIKLIKEHTDGH
jgi:hypothetical protein